MWREMKAMLNKLAAGTVWDAPVPMGLSRRLMEMVLRLERMLETHRQRRALLALSDHMLHDLGLGRADAYREAARPFWDLPGHRA